MREGERERVREERTVAGRQEGTEMEKERETKRYRT